MLCSLLCTLLVCLVGPARSAAVVGRSAVVSGHWLWRHGGGEGGWEWGEATAAGSHQTVRVMLGLAQRPTDLSRLDRLFEAVADPCDAKYRKHLTAEQARRLVRPVSGAVEEVRLWLAEEGGLDHHNITAPLSDALEVVTTVAVAERLFAVRMRPMRHRAAGLHALAAHGSPPTVPARVAGLVHVIDGLSPPPPPPPQVKRAVAGPPPVPEVPALVPQTVWSQYSVPSLSAASIAAPGNRSQGVAEFFSEFFDPGHLRSYWGVVGMPGSTPVPRLIGVNNASAAAVEADLDLQIVAAVGLGGTPWVLKYPAPYWFYGMAASMAAAAELPGAVSITNSVSEELLCSGVIGQECRSMGLDAASYFRRADTELKRVGLRGCTLVAASGDSGAPGRADPYCDAARVVPEYPGTSTAVTAVGGTSLSGATAMSGADVPPVCPYFPAGCAAGLTGTERAPEFSRARYSSGGGFSGIASRPSYQHAAVSAYLTRADAGLPPASAFNARGRAMPDLAALSYPWVMQGTYTFATRGTSVAAPIVAALMGFLTDASLAASGRRLGFVNPLLYRMAVERPDTFTDVVVGSNRCTEAAGCLSSCMGYNATAGWDAVTGLGTPNVTAMLEFVRAL